MELLPRTLAELLVERVIYKVNSFQFTRSARLLLALQRNAEAHWRKTRQRTFAPLPHDCAAPRPLSPPHLARWSDQIQCHGPKL